MESDRATPPLLSGEQMRRFVEALAAVGEEVPHHVLQVDYEAVASQRAFFIDAIAALRRRLPGGSISVTALASWCLNERWTARLDADEVVPMLFRMGYEGRRVRALFANRGDFREPGCRSSLGVATDELPAVLPGGPARLRLQPAALERGILHDGPHEDTPMVTRSAVRLTLALLLCVTATAAWATGEFIPEIRFVSRSGQDPQNNLR